MRHPTEGITEVQGCTTSYGAYLKLYQWNSAADAVLDAQQHEQGRCDDGSLVSAGDLGPRLGDPGHAAGVQFVLSASTATSWSATTHGSLFRYQLYAGNKCQTYRLWGELDLRSVEDLPDVP